MLLVFDGNGVYQWHIFFELIRTLVIYCEWNSVELRSLWMALFCIQDYQKALKYIDAILKVEPSNHQARQLRTYTEKKMKKGVSWLIILHVWLLIDVDRLFFSYSWTTIDPYIGNGNDSWCRCIFRGFHLRIYLEFASPPYLCFTEGLIGMALVGGAAAVGIAGIGALIGLAVARK